MTATASPPLAPTRDSWHRVAEHVLAAGQYAAAGTIRLRPSPGGFRTTVGVDGRQLAVVGDRLVVTDGGGDRSTSLTTLRAAAAFAGVTPGLSGSYAPATSADPDAPLTIDADAAEVLAAWFALGDAALRRFSEGIGRPQEPVLWPEHFDVGIALDAVNYGVSPGDDAIPDPYLYVGPHEGPPSADAYWNAPFGAAITADRIRTTDDAVAFFEQGRALTDRSGQ
ncbi:MAG TPA: hypothetical protein VHF92_18740 [Geodermatophilus sp.]|nr:hypothetical protein [Geodermatophilus sp.]